MISRALALAVFGSVFIGSGSGIATADERRSLTHQGVERFYELHIPANAPGATPPVQKRALVISLHGHEQTLDSLRAWLRFEPVADREGFVVALPEALQLKWSYGRPIVAPMPEASGAPADDVGFIRAIIERLAADGIADPARVYAAGLSRGGLMSFTLACAMADRLAGVAPMITGMTEYQIADCKPVRPVPMLVLAGTDDLVQRYDGWIVKNGRLASVPETMEYWRRIHGCTGQRSKPLPDIARNDRSSVGVVTWTGCATEGSLVYYRVFGGGHRLPSFEPPDTGPPGVYGARNRDIETAEEVWSFFKELRLPQ